LQQAWLSAINGVFTAETFAHTQLWWYAA